MKRILIFCLITLMLVGVVGCGATTGVQTAEEEEQDGAHLSSVTVFNTRTGEVVNVYENVRWIYKKQSKRKKYITIEYYLEDGRLTYADVGLSDDISYFEREEE